MADYKKTVIVDSITNDEIIELLRDDFVFLQHKIDENLRKYKQMVKNSVKKERVYYQPLNYKSAKGFHYMLQFFKRADDEPDKDKLGMIYYVWFIKNRGTYAVTLSRGQPRLFPRLPAALYPTGTAGVARRERIPCQTDSSLRRRICPRDTSPHAI